MDRLNQTTHALNSIDDVVTKLLKRAVILMKQLETDDSSFVDDLTEEFSNLDAEDASIVLREVSLEMIKDANVVRGEINNFAECIVNNEDIENISTGLCDFFKEVWLGDAYGESGISGLKELEKDLRQQLSQVNKVSLIKMAGERIASQ